MEKPVVYEAKDFSKLLGIPGFSDTLLNNHFKLYQGYVKNTAAVQEKLNALTAEGKDRTPEFGELKRRFGWEFNGMRLHEYYFANLGAKEQLDAKSDLAKRITDDFGSFDEWKKDFVSTGVMRGIGWVILYQDPANGRLFNVWINEHDAGHLAGAKPLLVLDVFEHAFFTDYQTDRPKYIEAFFAAIDWKAAAARLK
ncbi:MAG: Fe-Mn family superoxide dismutase [Candidatus Omnitrophica bacterium]|nr:Fe-Mn family superoxide dismutase [Candidatus Omnitrophota bacterium]